MACPCAISQFESFDFVSLTVGGVGKTLLTASVVRDERVRAAFQIIVWINLSQVLSLND